MSRSLISEGIGSREQSASIRRRRPETTAGSYVRTSASQVLRKHFFVKFSDVTSAGPSSATRYFAWYLTTGSVYGLTAAPVRSSVLHNFASFFLPPFARDVTSTSTATPRRTAAASSANT